MDRKKLLIAYLIYRAGQNGRKPEPERQTPAPTDGGGRLGVGCTVIFALLGVLLGALLIWIFR